jgi:hypothetical protein
MKHNIKGLTRTLAAIAGATLFIAACGGGSSSSGRQRNSAFCYATQGEKDMDISIAKQAFDNEPSALPDRDAAIESDATVSDAAADAFKKMATLEAATAAQIETARELNVADENWAAAGVRITDAGSAADADPTNQTLRSAVEAELMILTAAQAERNTKFNANQTAIEAVTTAQTDLDSANTILSDAMGVAGAAFDSAQGSEAPALTEAQQGFWDAMNAAEVVPVCELTDAEASGSPTAKNVSEEHICSYEFSLNESNGVLAKKIEEQSTNCNFEGIFGGTPVDESKQTIMNAQDSDGQTLATFVLDFSGVGSVVQSFSYTDPSSSESTTTSSVDESSTSSSTSSSVEEAGDEVTCSVKVDAMDAVFSCAKQLDAMVHVTYNGGSSTETFTGTGNTSFSVGAGATGYFVYACPVGDLANVYSSSCYLNSENLWTEGNDRTIEFNVSAAIDDANVAVDSESDSDMTFTSTLNTELTRSVIIEVAEGGVQPHFIFTGDCAKYSEFELVDTANRSEWNGYWGSQDIGDSKCGMDFTLQEGPGTYELWFNYGDAQTLSVLSNVEWESLDYADFKLPSLSFNYELPDSRTADYSFTITEPTVVSFTASAGETCTLDETGEEGNGFADPELDLYYVDDNGYWDDDDVAHDDDGGHGPGNCSAAWIQVELEPGNYALEAMDDDREGGVVTVNSSVELTLIPSNDPQTFSDITAPKSYTITVPAGGKDFVAIANSGNSEDVCDDYYWDQELPYVDPYLVLVNTQTGAFFRDDNDGEDEGFACLSSYLDVFLEEGTYTLFASTYEIARNDPDDSGLSGFDYSFGMSEWAMEKVKVAADPIPDSVPAPAVLPVENLKIGSTADSQNIAIASTVNSMECNKACIETLFVAAGMTDGTLTINAGAESVVISQGQRKAVIPVGKKAKNISVRAKSASGEVVVLSSGIAVLPAEVTAQLEVATGSTSLGGSSNSSGTSTTTILFMVLGVLVLAGAGTTLVRRRKAN